MADPVPVPSPPPAGTPPGPVGAAPPAVPGRRRLFGLVAGAALVTRLPWLVSALFHASLFAVLAITITSAILTTTLKGAPSADIALVPAEKDASPAPATAPVEVSAQPLTESRLQEILESSEGRPQEAPPTTDPKDADRALKSIENLIKSVNPRLASKPTTIAATPPLSPGDLEPSEAVSRLLEESGADEPSTGTARPTLSPSRPGKGTQGNDAKDDDEIHKLGQELRDNGHRHQHAVVTQLMGYGTPKAIEEVIYSLKSMSRCPRHQATNELEAATGQHFGLDADAWEKWWKENKDQFDPDRVLTQRLDSLARDLGCGDRTLQTKALAQLAQVQSPLAIGVIVRALPDIAKIAGQLPKNAYATLHDMVDKYMPGQRIADDPAAWQRWWEANKDALAKKK